jgi:hypothetical protein
MNGRMRNIVLAGFALLLSVIWLSADVWAQGGPILRLAADFKNFDGTETSTMVGVDPAAGLDGIAVFRKTVFVPAGVNTLYVTISTTGDSHDGAAIWMACRVNGVPCNPGFGGAGGTPAGWIALQKHKNWIGIAGPLFGDGGGGGGDVHDNSLYYTWCTKTRDLVGGPTTVELRMGSSGPTRPDETGGIFPPFVFFEAAHFYIDASRITGNNACTPAPPVEG